MKDIDFEPEYAVEISDPKIDLKGYLVVDNTALGVGKGGIRMTAEVTRDEVARLARTMTYKNALAGIPFGGAKAGLVWPGGDTTRKKAFVQSFARALKPFLVSKYIAGPDVNSGEREMRWFVEAAGNLKSATGKPVKLGGLPHELGSTGFGVFCAVKIASRLMGLSLAGARVAIEGFGNVGTFAFKFLDVAGAKIVAVSDRGGTIYDEKGLVYAEVMAAKKRWGSVTGLKHGTELDREAVFGVPADILIPAAVTDAITEKNKNSIKARLIVEGSNIPMREGIENGLHKKGIVIVPDFVANAGGVISSYAEHKGFGHKKMFALVETKVSHAVNTVIHSALMHHKNPREVALELARSIITSAIKRRKHTF